MRDVDRLRGERVDTMNQEEEKCWPQYKGGWVDDTPKNIRMSSEVKEVCKKSGWSR